MAVVMRNVHGSPVTLPWPYRGVLQGGQAIVLAGTLAHVRAVLGDSVSSRALKLREVVQHANFDDAYVDGAASSHALFIDATTTVPSVRQDGSPTRPYATVG